MKPVKGKTSNTEQKFQYSAKVRRLQKINTTLSVAAKLALGEIGLGKEENTRAKAYLRAAITQAERM